MEVNKQFYAEHIALYIFDVVAEQLTWWEREGELYMSKIVVILPIEPFICWCGSKVSG